MQLSDDSTKATLAINQTLTAAEVEDLIRELAMLRTKMTPEVRSAPQDSDDGNAPVMIQSDPTLAFEHPAKEAHVTMYLRSSGLGWTAWRLHPNTQKALADFFYSRLPKSTSGPLKIAPRK